MLLKTLSRKGVVIQLLQASAFGAASSESKIAAAIAAAAPGDPIRMS
jgi:hypothetical protein